MSTLTVILTILVYPGGLIALIFALVTIQWVWLGYQLYAMLAMHVYRFNDGEHVGTTQKWIGRELHRTGQVLFEDGSGNKLVAHLETSIVPSVIQGRLKVESLVERVLQEHAVQAQAKQRQAE
jgi:hypothetical protein